MGRRAKQDRLSARTRGGCFYFILFEFLKEEEKKMKKTVSLILALVLAAALIACGAPTDTGALWENALYNEDAELGDGAKTVKVKVEVGEKSVVFTVKSDEAMLGDALMAHGLIEGDIGQYGMYVKKVNGIVADYDIDGHYWGFYKDGDYVMTGIDMTEFADGESYELVYEK